ncbi:hypothetical protein ETAA8_13540 [Anatilimnocola aggregata]|uniref:Uncharacterized protein n=1 Tax=Anatilimnocola aggregata TaxID=2528021 RepID=A0A517Y7S2_9BACT|nr:hypothetical protein [Anatilimnocola aggregata]QDU26277.1 hypothetical protein ETAA8_13540 [Anatilimnocola aggregata]
MIAAIIGRIKPYGLVIGLALAFAAGAVVNGWRLDGVKDAAVKAKESEMVLACEAAQKQTQEVSRGYQNELAKLNSRLSALRMQPAKCVPVSTSSSRRDAASIGGEHSGPHVVSDLALIELAGEAERYRLQLIACQAFAQSLPRESN